MISMNNLCNQCDVEIVAVIVNQAQQPGYIENTEVQTRAKCKTLLAEMRLFRMRIKTSHKILFNKEVFGHFEIGLLAR